MIYPIDKKDKCNLHQLTMIQSNTVFYQKLT